VKRFIWYWKYRIWSWNVLLSCVHTQQAHTTKKGIPKAISTPRRQALQFLLIADENLLCVSGDLRLRRAMSEELLLKIDDWRIFAEDEWKIEENEWKRPDFT
jgi:hypothetical protein